MDAVHKVVAAHRRLSVYEGYNGIPYVRCDNGEMCVPLTSEGNVIFIHEPTAYGNGDPVLFLPAGVIEPDEDPATSANRELQEEIGFRAEQLDFLGKVRPWVKYLDATLSLFLARDLTPGKLQGDESHSITSEQIPLARFEGEIEAGRLSDSSAIAALFVARQWLNQEGSG